MKYNRFFRMLSILLVISLLMQMGPLSILAASPASKTNEAEVSTEQAPATIVREEESLRNVYEKHFLLSDGSNLAVAYGVPVHYQNEDGVWQDIDNSLTQQTLKNGVSVYTTANAVVPTAFSSSLATGNLFTSSNGSDSVSMTLLDTSTANKLIAQYGSINASEGISRVDSANLTFNRNAVATIFTDTDNIQTVDTNSAVSSTKQTGWTTEDILPQNLSSSIIYEDVFPDVDFRYTTHGYSVKEEIIVNTAKETYIYHFLLALNGYTPQMNDDGSISLLNEKQEAIYYIPAPYMTDDAGEHSDKVTYTLTEVDNGVLLTVEADANWINAEGRQFPVTIDPTLSYKLYAWTKADAPFFFAQCRQGMPNEIRGFNQAIHTGFSNYIDSDDGGYMERRWHLFSHFNVMPELPVGSIITDATLRVWLFDYDYKKVPNLDIGAYEVTSDKGSYYTTYRSWLYNTTWNSQPTYNTDNVIDYATACSSMVGQRLEWNLTELAKKWYQEGTTNRTIALIGVEDASFNSSYFGEAEFTAYHASRYPIFTISYRSMVGIEPYYTYATLGAGHAGTAYLADASGQLKVVKNITSYTSAVNPVSLNLVYTSDYFSHKKFGSDGTLSAAQDYLPPTACGLNMSLGSGWSLDAIQSMAQDKEDKSLLVYTDGDGTKHYFIPSSDGNYYDEDGLALKVTAANVDSNNYTMSDDKDNVWVFEGGLLRSMTDASGNKILINYASNKLTSVQQKNNEQDLITVASFTYTGDVLTSITDAAGNTHTLVYTNGKLTSINKSSGPSTRTIATYGYTGYGISSLKDNETDYTLNFTYNAAKRHYTEYWETGSSTSGAHVSITYPNYSTTVYRDYGNDRTASTDDDILTYYLFDYAGRTANAYTTDCDGRIIGASNSVYSAYDGTAKTNNRTVRTASIGASAQQLLHGSDFETTTYPWTYSGSERSTAMPRTGYYSLKGSGTSSATRNSMALYAGTTYSLSAYVNTSQINEITGAGVYLGVAASDGSSWTSDAINFKTSEQLDGGWIRISVTFTATMDGYHPITIYSDGVNGTFYVDDLYLHAGYGPSTRNMVENGGMQVVDYAWTRGTAATYLDSSGFDGTRTMQIVGTPTDDTANFYQDITINLPSSQTYVLSGWVKANSVAERYNPANDTSRPADTTAPDDLNRNCGLRAIITYSDDSTEYHYAPFNSDLSDWQFTTMTIVPRKSNATVKTIRVICAYEKNANIAYFDNISLTREAAQTMAYDDDGNLISVTSPNLSEDTNTYSNGNLVKTITGGNGTYEYTYDNKHRLTKVTVQGVTLSQSMNYDTVGNVTSTTLAGSGAATIQTSATYTNAGNLVSSVTDGNGSTISYAYADALNKMYGLPSSVTKQKDTTTITTTSTYDDYGRITGNAIENTASLGYTYNYGTLTSVERTANANNSTVSQAYHFTYDVFDNMTSVRVGSRQLASYTYGTGNGQLVTQTYGNGDTVTFTYDDLGRTKTATYSDGKTLVYQYNGEGLLHTITETVGTTTSIYYYTYDSLGRLISSHKRTGSTSVLLTNQTYNTNNQLTKQAWQMGNTAYVQEYTYNSGDGSLDTMTTGSGSTLTMGYDALRRLSTVNAGVYTKTYNYRDLPDTQTTTQISSLEYSVNDGQTYSYTYDDLGNIATYTRGETTYTYSYDNQNQLLSATDGTKTYTYTYDTAGNILTANGLTYTYGNSDWRDLLTAFDERTITYDTSGNPLSYYNGTEWTFTWQNGRELATATNGTNNISYAYDLNGVRTSKTVDGVVHNYIYASGKLLRETYGNNTLDFFYDSNGTPFALKYNGTLYYYITNLQGDVMNLVDANGTVVATYDYDPFGNVIGLDGTMATTNPLRYRGYYYDSESSLYYLQSRYYDPAIGRFINADSYASTGQDIIGHNMFAYCNNNPVLYTDSMGLWPSLADVFTTVAATIAVVATVVACVAAVPVFMGVGGTAVVASATAVASASAKVATVAGATALVAQKTKQYTKTYTIYTLSDPETKDVVYVGRTSNYPVRMQAHSLNVYRRGLDPKILHENLNYLQARAAEQAYILYYSTINKSDKKYNQINGVNPRRTDYTPIMKNGFGISEALDSILTNKIMCLLE